MKSASSKCQRRACARSRTPPSSFSANGMKSRQVLLFLLGGADVIAAYHGQKGWFPEWPGLDYFPDSLFDADVGLTAIPKYWLTE